MKPTAVVLDDETEIAALIRRALVAEGYSVRTAAGIAEFREAVAMGPVDLFVLDLELPDVNGISLVKEIRRKSDVGIIILTARADETDQVVGLEVGADDYVTKPFRLREFRARANAVLRRTRGARLVPDQPVVAVDGSEPADFSFDGAEVFVKQRRVAFRSGEDIALTTLEFDLLLALLKRRGHVLSREQIMQELRGHDWSAYDRSVDNLVSRLRRKLGGKGGAGALIHTVYGAGYCLVGDDGT